MASKLAPWRRLLTLRSRVVDGEALLLKAAEANVARAQEVFASFALEATPNVAEADELTRAQAQRDDSWHELVRCEAIATKAQASWQAAKREQRQAEILLERHVAAHNARRERQEQTERDDWQRARFAGEREEL